MFCAPGLVFGGSEGVRSRFHVFRSRACFRRCGGRRVLFSCFALPDSFLAVPKALCPVSIFCAPGLVLGGTEGVIPIFLFCPPRLVFGGTEGVKSRFHVLCSRTRFRRCRGRRVPFSCFTRPHSSAEPRASGIVFMFCAPELVLGGTEGVGSRFHVFSLLSSLSVVPRASGPIFMVGAPRIVSTVPRASGLAFMFCAPGLVLGGTKGVVSPFHVLRSLTRFRRYRGRRVPFTYFARPNSFSTTPGASGPVFIFCTPGLIFGGSEGVGSHFHDLHARALIIGGTEGVDSCFQVLRSRTHF
jgi:hypothetical protein